MQIKFLIGELLTILTYFMVERIVNCMKGKIINFMVFRILWYEFFFGIQNQLNAELLILW